MIKIIKANNNSIAAGADVNIIVDGNSFSIDMLVDAIKNMLSPELMKVMNKSQHLVRERVIRVENISEIVRFINMIGHLDLTDVAKRYSFIQGEIKAGIKNLTIVSETINNIKSALLRRNYKKAHTFLGIIINGQIEQEIKQLFLTDYFMTGYIVCANSGDIAGIFDVMRSAKKWHIVDKSLKLFILRAHQEYSTRMLESSGLYENEKELRDIINDNQDDDKECLNLLGMCLRRLGERGDNAKLEEAVDIFKKLVKINPEKREYSNNLGVSLVRLFEFNRDLSSLRLAEQILLSIDKKRDVLEIEEYFAIPKAYNNLGNVYKLMISIDNDAFRKSISAYNKAEEIWTINNAPYEWAMINKNRAEARLEAAQKNICGMVDLEIARKEILEAMRYRRIDNAPFQFKKTENIYNKIESLITQNSLN
jgi:tetratricopeptide (TPR) repeat protein